MKTKLILLIAFCLLISTCPFAQNIFPPTGAAGIGTTSPNASALLDINSLSKGILIPRMTAAQRSRIILPATGLLVYQTNGSPGFYYYDSSAWRAVTTKGWLLTGNAGTDSSVNFIGTTDAHPLVFKVNNQKAGWIDYNQTNTAGGNTSYGYQALYSNTTGSSNTANGYQALYANTTGGGNTAYGANSLGSNTIGGSNTAFGLQALSKNVDGSENTASGAYALMANTSGRQNTATGLQALSKNLTGNYNTAAGYNALRSNESGSYNTGVGSGADVANNALVNATVIGSNAYANCSNCIVLGSIKGVNGATASVSVGIGTINPGSALDVQSSTFTTAINAKTNAVSGNGLIAECDATGSPYGVWGICTNTSSGYAGYFSGNLHYTGTLTGPSDQKLKENIKPVDKMLDKIMQLKPSLYNYKKEYNKMNLPQGRQMGFIAQDMEKVFPQLVTNNYDKSVDSGKIFQYKGINYIGLIPVLTKAIQELAVQGDNKQLQIDSIKQNNQSLNDQLDALADRLDKIENAVSQCYSLYSSIQSPGNNEMRSKKTDAPLLEQNTPNPFNSNTVIKYYLPAKTNNAQLVITDANGHTLKTIAISNKGAGQTTVSANTLSSGSYFYSLIIDGKKIDTKQMVLTK